LRIQAAEANKFVVDIHAIQRPALNRWQRDHSRFTANQSQHCPGQNQ
jgi:hypothetical protein